MSDIQLPWNMDVLAAPTVPPVAAAPADQKAEPRCLVAALDYQARGFSVVAIHPIDPDGRCMCRHANCDKAGKHVIGTWKEWQTQRRTENEVKTLFEKHPDAGVGIILDSSNIAVLDIDGPQGRESLEQLVAEGMISAADIKAAPQSKSGREGGGHHVWFTLPEDGPVARATGFRTKLDMMSAGLIVMPPSRHASGKHYTWARGLDEHTLAPLPAGLLSVLCAAEKPAAEAKEQSPAPGATIDAKQYVEDFISYLADPKRAVEGIGNRDTMLAAHIVPMGKALGLSKHRMNEIVAEHWFGVDGRCPVIDDYDFANEVARKYDNLTGTQPGEKQKGALLVADGFAKANEVPALPVWGETDESPADTTKADAAVDDLPPLTPAEWRARDLPDPDYLLGHWLHTTSRALIVGATGVGKTNFGLALAAHMAAGKPFLNWPARRPARVLYVDGEMSRRLMRQRIVDACRRLGADPETLFTLSHEDVPDFKPFNTKEGQAFIDQFMKRIGAVDFIVFDNIAFLLAGNMRETESWDAVQPWVKSLTARAIGQAWLHHTGHDETRSYGDKTREWGMDTVLFLTNAKQEGVDVSLSLEFRKARERTPANRSEFADINVALVNDEWKWRPADPEGQRSQEEQAVLMVLMEVLHAHEDDEPMTVQKAAASAYERTGKSKAVNTWRDRFHKVMKDGPQEIAGYVIRLEKIEGRGSNVKTALTIEQLPESDIDERGPFHED